MKKFLLFCVALLSFSLASAQQTKYHGEVYVAGGYGIASATGIMNVSNYIDGLKYYFYVSEIWYALTKMAFFAFFITTISAYCGYYAKGNSLEVGRASTRAVVSSSITIMIFDLILTQIMRV